MKFLLKTSIFIALLWAIHTTAQSFNLDWKPTRKITISQNRTINIPDFNENYYIDANNLPHFYHESPISFPETYTLHIENEQLVSAQDLGDIVIQNIPENPEFLIKSINSGGKWSKIIDIIPIYKDGNQIKKITRFSVESQVKSNTSTLSRQQTLTLSQPPQPILNKGTFYKIPIDTTGVYKIDYAYLQQNGIPTNFNPAQFKIYGNGGLMLSEDITDFRYNGLQENAIYAHGMEDGSFDPEDYFLFYAQGPNGYTRKGVKVEHSKHLYSNQAFYFINIDTPTQGKRIKKVDYSDTPNETFTEFDQFLFREIDNLNIYNVGRQWFEKVFRSNEPFKFSFNGTSPIKDVRIGLRFVSTNATGNKINLSINGQNATSNITYSKDFTEHTMNENLSGSYPFSGEISLDNSSNPAGAVYLDYITLRGKQELSYQKGQLLFQWFKHFTTNQAYAFRLANAPMVWDVSDITNAKWLTDKSSTYTFKTQSDFENAFVAFSASSAYIPGKAKKIVPQNLAELKNIQYIIVTTPEFLSQAERLAQVHEKLSHVTTAIVTTEQVYNEFSSGSQDITAIRDFFKFLYDQPNGLEYALLFGDSSYDYKDRIRSNTNFVPSYQSYISDGLANTYVTDDYFAILNDPNIPIRARFVDIAIGRLPASTQQEAQVLVDKSLAYLNQLGNQGTAFGDWRTQVEFVVDDDNPGSNQAFHTIIENKSVQHLEQNQPYLTIKKIYLDAYKQEGTSGGNRYPDVNRAMEKTLESGALLVNYFGHGGINGFAQERIFTLNEIKKANNFNRQFSRLPLYVTVTCDFTVWDVPQIKSAGEALIKHPNGGAFAMITTSRELAVTYGKGINDIIIKELFTVENNQYLPIGKALMKAKQTYDLGDEGLSVNLLGDPLISLARPQKAIAIDKINGQDFSTFNQTIQALDFVQIKGRVLDSSGATDTSFNGTLSGTLFDKAIDKKTLNNDGNIDVLEYSEQVNAIYKGNTQVKDGNFNFEFYVPKDINFTIGDGKLLLYAYDKKEDAVTYDKVKVGGINDKGLNDTEGPGIKLYMNNTHFAPGGITDRSPYLLACVTDSTGINSTGSGIGHDITQYLNDDIHTTTVLNDYFEGGEISPCFNPNLKDYQKGKVFYRLNNLELGEHTVHFKVWDINNNSSTASLDFIVMENGENKLHINRLLNWPNPFTTQTFFHFEHNCPTALEVQVQVFTVAGKLVKNIRQRVSSEPFREGFRTGKFEIPWDGLDDFGNKIGKGVYIYRVTVKGENGETCKGTATETEKLVILK